ncbi:ABC transporter ATP-binding protein [Paenibacillus fonticola]|uniref:ABC transporter ATP-binding protein n=1 Tax=Paenibacillus fonticola TaxID=379896 RepID=UPI000377036C|nr:ABC transporter ATP-binding protein [Paenibacillus fonticola]
MKDEEHILEVNNISKKLKGFELQQVSFSLKRGYIMGFIGPNGAGKSTTIRCMMGLAHIDSGQIKLFNTDSHTNMKALKQRIGFVYDQNVFFEDLTVEKNRQIISMFYDEWDDKIFYDYIHKFGVPLSTPVKSLSKGTAMKFALAVALSHNAELIIMDEPTSGLDPIFRKELLDVLQEVIQDANKAIFFSTHNISDLEHVADYITFIYDGKIQFCKETESILDHYVTVKGPKSLMELVEAHRPLAIKSSSLGFEAFMEKEQLALLNTSPDFKIERPALEDIMYYLVKSKNDKGA